jgi:hypothetical protein
MNDQLSPADEAVLNAQMTGEPAPGPLPWICTAVLAKRDAGTYVLALAGTGIPCIAASPAAWIVGLRGEAFNPWTCQGDAADSHEQTPRPEKATAPA